MLKQHAHDLHLPLRAAILNDCTEGTALLRSGRDVGINILLLQQAHDFLIAILSRMPQRRDPV